MAVDPSLTDPKAQAAFALHRFGLGPRPGGIAAIASDPRGALLAEIKAGPRPIASRDLLTSGAAARAAFDFVQQRNAMRGDAAPNAMRGDAAPNAMRGDAAPNVMRGDAAPNNTPKNTPKNAPSPAQQTAPAQQGEMRVAQKIYLAEAKAHYEAALAADTGLIERLTWFWGNHFAISAEKGQVLPLAGSYEREAIRPRVLGKFSDLLIAAVSHPAMLLYLDNARSIGPNSDAGKRLGKGLNENLAREILELHTLGVRTIYSQTDVTSLARIITGWSIVGPRINPARGGEFDFNAMLHEPGAHTVIGKTYPEGGIDQGRKVLEDLARHPVTARHIATKLVRHFVSDEPPPALVDKLSKRFLDTGGDLAEVTKALIAAPEAWSLPRTKLKKPAEWIVSAMRANGLALQEMPRIVAMQNMLGEPLWRPSSPKGFTDDSTVWLDGITQRLDIASQLARLAVNGTQEPDEMVDAVLGSLASRETRDAVKNAESRSQALALLVMAPEFQRR